MKTFPVKIREARKALKLTQAELGTQVGTSMRTISTYETGDQYPRRKMMAKLADALGVSVEYLKNDELETWPPVEATTDVAAERPALEAEEPAEEPVEEPAEEPTGRSEEDLRSDAMGDAMELVSMASALFAGGDLREEDKDLVFASLQRAYERCKRKHDSKNNKG